MIFDTLEEFFIFCKACPFCGHSTITTLFGIDSISNSVINNINFKCDNNFNIEIKSFGYKINGRDNSFTSSKENINKLYFRKICNNIDCFSKINLTTKQLSFAENGYVNKLPISALSFKIIMPDNKVVVINSNYNTNTTLLAFPYSKDFDYFAKSDRDVITTKVVNFDLNDINKIRNKISTILTFI